LGLLDFLKGLLGGSGKKQAKKKKKKRKPTGGKTLKAGAAASSSRAGKPGSKAKSSQFARKDDANGVASAAAAPAVRGDIRSEAAPAAPRAPGTGELTATVPAARGTGSLEEVAAEAYGAPEAEAPPPGPPPAKEKKRGGFFGFGLGPKRDTRKEGALLKELDPNIQRGDVIGVKLKLEDAAAVAAAYKLAAEEKSKNFGTTRTHLKNLVDERNYQAIALAAATVAGDAAFLGDPVIKKASEAMDLMPFVLKAAKSKKGEVFGLVNDFEIILQDFNALLVQKADYLEKVGDEIMKTLAKKDFAKVTGMAEAIVRDAEILAHQYDSGVKAEASAEEQGVSASGSQEKWKDIDKQVLQLSQVLLAKQYRFAADLAKIVSASGGVMGDPAFNKAIELIKGGKQLLEAFRQQKIPIATRMSTDLSRKAGVFNAPLMSRTNQISEQVAQLEKLQKDKEWDKLSNLAIAICRTSSLLVDPTIRRASLLSGEISKVEVYIKRKDFGAALNTLASSVD